MGGWVGGVGGRGSLCSGDPDVVTSSPPGGQQVPALPAALFLVGPTNLGVVVKDIDLCSLNACPSCYLWMPPYTSSPPGVHMVAAAATAAPPSTSV